ncbi:MAG: hypothetical protein FJW31_27040 [Acidobacteria bacterium]|nr:hypothetical protein [Acidobacteriota bacterium]
MAKQYSIHISALAGRNPAEEQRVTPLKVLLVEDSPGYASLVLRWIAEGPESGAFTLVWTDTLSAALARLDERDIDVMALVQNLG